MLQEYRVGHSWNENMRLVLGPHLRAFRLVSRKVEEGARFEAQLFATHFFLKKIIKALI